MSRPVVVLPLLELENKISEFPLEDKLLIIETSTSILLHYSNLSKRVRDRCREYSHFLCSQEDTFLNPPIIQNPYVDSLIRVWKVRHLNRDTVEVTGQVYLGNNEKPRQLCAIFDFFHIRPHTTMTLPLKCSLFDFATSKFEQTFEEPVVEEPLDTVEQFTMSHQVLPCWSWMCNRYNSNENEDSKVLCKYNSHLRVANTSSGVYGGVIAKGCSSGKTTHMFRRCLQRCKVGIVKRVLFLSSRRDMMVINDIPLDKKENRVTIKMWCVQASESKLRQLRERGSQTHNPLFLVLNTQCLSFSSCRDWLVSQSWDTVVIDDFQRYDPMSTVGQCILSMSYRTMWLLSSEFNMIGYASMCAYLRLVDTIPGFQHLVEKSILFLDIVRKLTIFTSDRIHLPDVLWVISSPFCSDYPIEQVLVSLRTALQEDRKASDPYYDRLLSTLTMLQSGVPMFAKDVDETLLEYSGRVKPGGEISINFPSYASLQTVDHDKDRFCTICLSSATHPVRNEVCSHVFCFACLEEWNRHQSKCPLCKVRFKNVFLSLKAVKRVRLNPENAPVTVSEPEHYRKMYNDYSTAALRNFQQVCYKSDKIRNASVKKKFVIFTSWKDMLHNYGELTTPSAVLPKINPRNYSRLRDVIAKSSILVSHVDNIDMLRSNPNIGCVFLADTNGSHLYVHLIRIYFPHAEKIIGKSHQSIMDYLINNYRVENQFPKILLQKYLNTF
jgi:hypothetical protein